MADPNEYKNLFSNFNQTLEAEQMLAKERKRRMPASMYKQVPVSSLVFRKKYYTPSKKIFAGSLIFRKFEFLKAKRGE